MIVFLCLYELVLLLGIPFYSIFCRIRGKCNSYSLREKLAFYRHQGVSSSSVWIQVVSVGEAFAINRFVHELHQNLSYRIVISTTTLTGFSVARRLYSSVADVIFFPFDEIFTLKRALRIINPRLFVAIETELWPFLFYLLKKRDIPVVILNGRISNKAYSRYRRVRYLTKKVLSLCRYIGVQDEFYRHRFLELGAPSERVFIGGNMKFYSIVVMPEEKERIWRKYRHILKKEGEFLFVAASTHSPEEKIILDIYKRLKKDFPLRLLIAPRHPERVAEIMEWVEDVGEKAIALSNVSSDYKDRRESVFVLDTVGELFYIFEMADVCFVGGSIVNYGGHNILEPLYFLKPTVFGPFMDNFRAITESVLENRAAIQVKNSGELEKVLRKIITDESLREKIKENAHKVFWKAQEYLDKNMGVVKQCLS